MTSTNKSSHYILFYLMLLCLTSVVILRYNLYRLPLNPFFHRFYSHCFSWKSATNQSSKVYDCLHYSHYSALLWTYDGTGLSKYLQWIIIRKLANVQITRLDDRCQIINQHLYSINHTNQTFIQIYIMPLSVSLSDQSQCAIKINQITTDNIGYVNQIYFKRKSVQSTFFFQQLDLLPFNSNYTAAIDALRFRWTEKTDYLMSEQWPTLYSEDLIRSDLIDCEKMLTKLLRLLGVNTSSPIIQNIINYDSHQFIDDATWWDQSDVAQCLLNHSLPSRPSTLNYSNDFYYLHGNRPFIDYLYTTRRCFIEGVFPQLQVDTMTNRSSIDKLDRCARKPFDCAFSDLYSFADREQIYQSVDSERYANHNTLKCGFAVPSIFDQVRRRYARNHTCQTIVFTLITGCYDPLPQLMVRFYLHFVSLLCLIPRLSKDSKVIIRQNLKSNGI